MPKKINPPLCSVQWGVGVADSNGDGVVRKVGATSNQMQYCGAAGRGIGIVGEKKGGRAGVGMMSGRTMSTPSGKKSDHIFMIPHSKNGRCTSLRFVDGLGREGQHNVGWGCGRRRRGSWVSNSLNFGMSHELIAVIVGRRRPNVGPALPLAPSSLSPALQQLLLPPRALPYILPWPSHRARNFALTLSDGGRYRIPRRIQSREAVRIVCWTAIILDINAGYTGACAWAKVIEWSLSGLLGPPDAQKRLLGEWIGVMVIRGGGKRIRARNSPAVQTTHSDVRWTFGILNDTLNYQLQ
ncbi:hypothetical protein ARMSODRAFT_978374 [Armillaria solidipes]|uniref:Uncharacterized protein n=1 Tax=Armillaria solidipes TaxID=1076256 RepID=A0A2H3BN09_9AGAR|nr:hypothetical protein ARMSODRAFT_978374 [Armillaria solidipes]